MKTFTMRFTTSRLLVGAVLIAHSVCLSAAEDISRDKSRLSATSTRSTVAQKQRNLALEFANHLQTKMNYRCLRQKLYVDVFYCQEVTNIGQPSMWVPRPEGKTIRRVCYAPSMPRHYTAAPYISEAKMAGYIHRASYGQYCDEKEKNKGIFASIFPSWCAGQQIYSHHQKAFEAFVYAFIKENIQAKPNPGNTVKSFHNLSKENSDSIVKSYSDLLELCQTTAHRDQVFLSAGVRFYGGRTISQQSFNRVEIDLSKIIARLQSIH